MCSFQDTHIRKFHVFVTRGGYVQDVALFLISATSFQAVEYDGRFFVNPGSATGAWIGSYNGCVTAGFSTSKVSFTMHLAISHPRSL